MTITGQSQPVARLEQGWRLRTNLYLRFARYSALGLLAAAGALAAAQAPVEPHCGTALLRNGFAVQCARREAAGTQTRLWICDRGDAGYVEIASDQIESFEPPENAPSDASVAASRIDEAPRSGPAPVDDPIQSLIAAAATRYRIDPDFVTSVVGAESGFNPQAVSPKGAAGLMQLIPRTAAGLGVRNVWDPTANVDAGTKYLRQLLDRYQGDALKALAAYNAGPQRVQQFGGVPPYPETRAYISRVIEDFNRRKQGVRKPDAARPSHSGAETR